MILANNNAQMPVMPVTLAASLEKWPSTNSDSAYTDLEHAADVANIAAELRSAASDLASRVRKNWVTRASVRSHSVKTAHEGLEATVTEPLGAMITGEVAFTDEGTIQKIKCYSANNVRNTCYIRSMTRQGVILVTPASQAFGLAYQLEMYLKGRSEGDLNAAESKEFEEAKIAFMNNMAKYGPAWFDLQDAVIMDGDYMYVPRTLTTAALAKSSNSANLSWAEVALAVPHAAEVITAAIGRADDWAANFLALDLSELATDDLLMTDLTEMGWTRMNLSDVYAQEISSEEALMLGESPQLLRGIIPDIMARTEATTPLTALQWANMMYYYARGLSRLAGLDPESDGTAVSTKSCVTGFIEYLAAVGTSLGAAAAAVFERLVRGAESGAMANAPTTSAMLRAMKAVQFWLADPSAVAADLPEGVSANASVVSGDLQIVFSYTSGGDPTALYTYVVKVVPSGTTLSDWYAARAALASLDGRISLLQAAADKSGIAAVSMSGSTAILTAPCSALMLMRNIYAGLSAAGGTIVTPYMAG